MFFFGIFGVENKQIELMDVQNIICKSCGKMASYKLIKTYNFFHFFFIPLYKWNTKYYLVSRCCSVVYEISKELGTSLEAGENPIINDSELNEIYSKNNTNICPYCSEYVEDKFMFCPYCGKRIR